MLTRILFLSQQHGNVIGILWKKTGFILKDALYNFLVARVTVHLTVLVLYHPVKVRNDTYGELELMRQEATTLDLKLVSLERQKKTTLNLNQDRWCCDQDSNWVPSEYKSVFLYWVAVDTAKQGEAFQALYECTGRQHNIVT